MSNNSASSTQLRHPVGQRLIGTHVKRMPGVPTFCDALRVTSWQQRQRPGHKARALQAEVADHRSESGQLLRGGRCD